MMFRISLGAPEAAEAIEASVETALAAGHGTADIGGSDSCSVFAERIVDALT
jgi:3-isopropylmalate dehydrogenase